MDEASGESGELFTNAGGGRKRRSELELSSSTKLKAAAIEGGETQKQWIHPPDLQLGQASPELGEKAHDVSKTLAAGSDASKKRQNSGTSSLTPSGYKDTPILLRRVLVVEF